MNPLQVKGMNHLADLNQGQLFFFGKKNKSELNKFGMKNTKPRVITKKIESIFNFEKCNTLNYFLGSVLLRTCEIVLFITCTVTSSEI